MDVFNWQALIDLLLAPFMWALNGIVYVVGYALYYIMDGILIFVYGMLSALDLSGVVFNYAAEVAGLPPQLLYLLSSVSFFHCLSLITGAYLLRLVLNLIPGAVTRV